MIYRDGGPGRDIIQVDNRPEDFTTTKEESAMPSDDNSTESLIQRLGATAPRIDPPALAGAIIAEYYIRGTRIPKSDEAPEAGGIIENGLSCLTICVLVLANGFTVVGESGCASPENYRFEIGKKIAREKAIDKVWPLLGYELRTKLHNEKLASSDGVDACELPGPVSMAEAAGVSFDQPIEVTTADLTPPSGTASSKG